MRTESLEAEKKLLAAAEARATSEATELSREKFRLAAELEAARKVHADREAELLAEVTRLKEEVGARPSRALNRWLGAGAAWLSAQQQQQQQQAARLTTPCAHVHCRPRAPAAS